jgi:HD-GYP domain-containing protein (c-di-GMP phosphodiesterase class II)
MISDRPYRRAIKRNKIMDELKRCSGTQFDPLVVDAALQVLGRHEEAEQTLVTNPSQQPMIEFNQSVQRVS